MTTTTTATVKVAPKHIPVNGHPIKFRFAQQVIWTYLLTTIAVAAVAAVYYLLFEVKYSIGGHTLVYLKPGWDGLIKKPWWPVARHNYRNIGEGVVAAWLVKTLITDWRKHPEQRLSVRRMVILFVLLVEAAFVLVTAGIYLLDFAGPNAWHHFFHHHHLHTTVTMPGWLATWLAQYNWPALITGAVAGQILHRLWRPIGSTINLILLEHAAVKADKKGREPVWVRWPLMPPNVRERYSWINSGYHIRNPGKWPGRVAASVVVVVFALAVYGEYVLQIVAKHK